MKNLKNRKLKNAAALFFIVLLAVCAAAAPSALSVLQTPFIQSNLGLISVVCTAVLLIAALVIFRKNIRNIVITQAVSANAVRLRTDRRSYPAARVSFSAEDVLDDLHRNGFSSIEWPGPGFAAERRGNVRAVVIVSGAESEKEVLAAAEKFASALPVLRTVKNVCVPCFLGSDYDEDAIYRSKNVENIPGGCMLPVYCDVRTSRAYYMGGRTGGRSAENAAQKIIKDIILKHPMPYPPKTESDITDEEREFESLDIECILRGINSPSEKDLSMAQKLDEGQFIAVEEGGNGRAYYKYRGRTVAHSYVRYDTVCRAEPIANVYYCAPRVRPASADAALHFRAAFERYCEQNGLVCEFERDDPA